MILEDIAWLLHDKGLGTFDPMGVSGNIFICTMPPDPDEIIALYPRGGPRSDVKLGYDTHRIQIMVRGTVDPRTGLTRAQNIFDALHGIGRTTLRSGTLLLDCLGVQSGPVVLGPDTNGRYEYSLNFDFEIRNTSRIPE